MVLPVLMVAFLVVVQIGVVARDQVLVHHAVREAARQVALDPSEASARTAALAAAPSLDDDRLSVVLVGGTDVGQIATIELRYQAPTRVPVVGAFLGDVPLRTDASVRIE